MEPNFLADHETELTLAICSETPSVLWDKIAALGELGGFALIPDPPLTIHDTYFDKQDQALRRSSWALRIRIVGEKRLLTVKGPATIIDSGIISRTEIEREWSRPALAELHRLLEKLGVSASVKSQPFRENDPALTLLELGLTVIQKRHVLRLPRRVAPKDAREHAWAELVIDRVSYDFGDQRVRHFELEIEFLTSTRASELSRVVDALKHLYGEELRTWPYGKLSTGLAIQALLPDNTLRGLIQAECLLPTAYDKIAAILSRRLPSAEKPSFLSEA